MACHECAGRFVTPYEDLMKAAALSCLAFACAASVLTAGPVEEAIVAAVRLSEHPSYSWISTVNDDARTYDIVGRTTSAGYSQVRMPVVNTVRQRLGRGVTDAQVDFFFRGNVDCVIATDEGWKSVGELPLAADTSPMLGTTSLVHHSSRSVFGRNTGIRSSSKFENERGRRSYSNLQMGLSHPHEELGVIVSSGIDLQAEGDTLTGSLTDLGAQLLLVRDGQTEITPLQAAGTFTLWIRDGLVTRYQVKLQGVLAIKTGLGTRQIAVTQNTSTQISDIGTTSVEVPFEVMAKLGR